MNSDNAKDPITEAEAHLRQSKKRLRYLGWCIASGCLVLVAAGVVCYIRVGSAGSLSDWADRADAIAPFASIASAGALLVAVWSVLLQKQELEESRVELVRQRVQLASSASAERELAIATRASNYTTALVALIQLRARVVEVKNTQGTGGQHFEEGSRKYIQQLEVITRSELEAYAKASGASTDQIENALAGGLGPENA